MNRDHHQTITAAYLVFIGLGVWNLVAPNIVVAALLLALILIGVVRAEKDAGHADLGKARVAYIRDDMARRLGIIPAAPPPSDDGSWAWSPMDRAWLRKEVKR